MSDFIELSEKFKSELEDASWDLIEPHYKREAVFYLKSPNDLVQVAVHLANNKALIVKALMDTGELSRPSEQQVDLWQKDSLKKFKFLIVRPFVLIQE